jgi:hypothetical protein
MGQPYRAAHVFVAGWGQDYGIRDPSSAAHTWIRMNAVNVTVAFAGVHTAIVGGQPWRGLHDFNASPR